jgi:serine protease Do
MRVAPGLALGLALAATIAGAAPAPEGTLPRVAPGSAAEGPGAVARVRPAIVGIRAYVAPDRPSAATLGTERWGTGVLLDADGLAVTVGYIVLEAGRLDVRLDSGFVVAARVVGHDFESGLALIRLDPSRAPYPVARLGRAWAVAPGDPVAIVGAVEGERTLGLAARVTAVRPFVAYWEYMLERAFRVAPLHPAFGGAALVDGDGLVLGLVSLRLPDGHVAIPIDLLAPVRDAMVRTGRPDRPPRPWLGLRALDEAGEVSVAGVTPGGPAAQAGIRAGDVIQRIDGTRVADVSDFYRRLWAKPVGQELELSIRRDGAPTTVTVRPRDRYAVYQFRSP